MYLQYRERKSKAPVLCKARLERKAEGLLESVSNHGLFSPPSSLRKLSATTSRGAFFGLTREKKKENRLGRVCVKRFFFFSPPASAGLG